jgi:hypothetical protein
VLGQDPELVSAREQLLDQPRVRAHWSPVGMPALLLQAAPSRWDSPYGESQLVGLGAIKSPKETCFGIDNSNGAGAFLGRPSSESLLGFVEARVIWTLAITALLVVVDPPPTATGPACSLTHAIGYRPGNARLDSTWYEFGAGCRGCKILSQRDRWLLTMTWFQLDSDAEHCIPLAALDSLSAAGAITDSTGVYSVPYACRVVADSPESAHHEAAHIQAGPVPGDVRKAFRKLRRAKGASPQLTNAPD